MNDIVKLIENANTIAITSHSDEDNDAFGSSLALCEALRSRGKKVTYFLSLPIQDKLSFLSDDYIIFDENKDFGEFDLLICLDSADEKRLGKRISLFKKAERTVNIDHHYTNTLYADINYVRGEMSSTGEMIYDLLVFMNVDITKKMAEFLYSAIMGDTGCLKYSCATPKTVAVISELMKTGIDHAELSRKLFDTEKLDVLKFKGHVMNSVKSYYNGEVNIVTLTKDAFLEYNIKESDAGDLVNIPRSVEGTQIAVALRETDDKIKVSFRSNGVYNVSDIAQKLGGGGHAMAAGAAVFDMSLQECEEKVIEAIGEFING